jgi:hypothetical protein
LLETDDAATLGVHPLDHVPAHAVLARRIDALQHDQHGMLSLGIEQLLELLHALEIALDLGLRLLAAFMLAVIGGIDVLEPHLASRLDDQLLAIVHGSILQMDARS